MNCDEFRATMDSFLDGELNDEKAAAFEIHFTSCPKCHMELESIDKCSKVLRRLLKPENPPRAIQDKVFRELDKDR